MTTDHYTQDGFYGEAAPTLPSHEQDAETWHPRRSAGAALWVIAGLAVLVLVAFLWMLRVTGGVS